MECVCGGSPSDSGFVGTAGLLGPRLRKAVFGGKAHSFVTEETRGIAT